MESWPGGPSSLSRRLKNGARDTLGILVVGLMLAALFAAAPQLMSWWAGPETGRASAGLAGFAPPSRAAGEGVPAAAAGAASRPLVTELDGADSTSLVGWGRRRRRRAFAGAPAAP